MNSVHELIYSITSDSQILLNKQLIYKEQTVQQWNVGIRRGDKNGWYMSVDVVEYPQTDQPASKPFHELLKLLNKPTAQLELFFNDQWYLQKIVNKAAILSCWQEIRKEIATQLGDSKEVLELIKEKDMEINNLEVGLPESTGYLILFNSFSRNKKIRFFTPSVLSSDGELDISLSVREEGGETGLLAYEGEGVLSSISALEKEYNQQVKLYAGNAPFTYHCVMQMEYLFDNTDDMLQKAVATITEQASEQYVYNHNLVFERTEVTINNERLL